MEFIVQSIDELPRIAKEILDFATGKSVFLFNGEIGAGKTTLIKEICRLLEVEDEVTSPTFSIINEYFSQKKTISSVFHIDLYRLKSTHEAIDIGIEEYLFSGNICLIEWPDIILNLIEINDITTINIEITENSHRKVVIL